MYLYRFCGYTPRCTAKWKRCDAASRRLNAHKRSSRTLTIPWPQSFADSWRFSNQSSASKITSSILSISNLQVHDSHIRRAEQQNHSIGTMIMMKFPSIVQYLQVCSCLKQLILFATSLHQDSKCTPKLHLITWHWSYRRGTGQPVSRRAARSINASLRFSQRLAALITQVQVI